MKKQLFLFLAFFGLVSFSPVNLKASESIKEFYKENKEEIQSCTKSFVYGVILRQLFFASKEENDILIKSDDPNFNIPLWLFYITSIFAGNHLIKKENNGYLSVDISMKKLIAIITGIICYNKLVLKQ